MSKAQADPGGSDDDDVTPATLIAALDRPDPDADAEELRAVAAELHDDHTRRELCTAATALLGGPLDLAAAGGSSLLSDAEAHGTDDGDDTPPIGRALAAAAEDLQRSVPAPHERSAMFTVLNDGGGDGRRRSVSMRQLCRRLSRPAAFTPHLAGHSPQHRRSVPSEEPSLSDSFGTPAHVFARSRRHARHRSVFTCLDTEGGDGAPAEDKAQTPQTTAERLIAASLGPSGALPPSAELAWGRRGSSPSVRPPRPKATASLGTSRREGAPEQQPRREEPAERQRRAATPGAPSKRAARRMPEKLISSGLVALTVSEVLMERRRRDGAAPPIPLPLPLPLPRWYAGRPKRDSTKGGDEGADDDVAEPSARAETATGRARTPAARLATPAGTASQRWARFTSRSRPSTVPEEVPREALFRTDMARRGLGGVLAVARARLEAEQQRRDEETLLAALGRRRSDDETVDWRPEAPAASGAVPGGEDARPRPVSPPSMGTPPRGAPSSALPPPTPAAIAALRLVSRQSGRPLTSTSMLGAIEAVARGPSHSVKFPIRMPKQVDGLLRRPASPYATL